MGADKKIGQHSSATTTLGAITLKHLAGEKQRGPWNLCAALPLLDPRRPDEIMGYDENGVP